MILKSLLFSFISLLLIGYGDNISNNTFPNNINNDIPLRLDKHLYIDLSLNSKFKEEFSNPLFVYKDSSEHILNLVHVKDYIYQTEESISIDFFKNDNNTFYVSCYEGNYKTEIVSASILQENENYICLDEYIDNQDTSIKGYGHYGDRLDNPGATYKTQRIWLFDKNNIEKDNQICISYTYEYQFYIVPMISYLNGSDYLCYVDIPYQLSSFSFLLMDNYFIDYEIPVSMSTYGRCYSLNKNNDNYESSIVTYSGASANLLGLVVEAYLTMGTYPSNGTIESTLSNVYSTWFRDKACSKEELRNVKISDYSSYSGDTYEGKEKDGIYSVYEKWATMCNRVNIDPWTGQPKGNNWFSFFNSTTLKIVLLIGAGVLVSAGGLVVYTIYRKKKQQ